MKIGIFSKFNMSGGSEFRCVELSNAVTRYTEHEAYLLCENKITREVQAKMDPKVNLVLNAVKDPELLYSMDNILVVNTDSNCFTTRDYWEGKSDRHKEFIDLTRMKSMTFLFNFIVSPARHLNSIEELCPEVKIITTNTRFFDEITTKNKHEPIRHLPRMILESPIDPNSISTEKLSMDIIRIGKHSMPMGQKFNEEHLELINRINEKHLNKVIWDFMGVPSDRKKELMDLPNVILRDKFTVPVKDYLKGIHIFLFFPSWKRQEPWARSVAEGLTSGCPVVATDVDGGNRMQVLHGNNGYLCKDLDDFEKYLSYLIENPEMIVKLGKNAKLYSRFFTAEQIINKYIRFIGKD
jgi:hypothetical protein